MKSNKCTKTACPCPPKKCPRNPTPLAFYASTTHEGSSATTVLLIPNLVPIGVEATFGTLAVTIDNPGGAAPGSSIVIGVYRNGMLVSGSTATFSPVTTSTQIVNFSQVFSPGDALSVRAILTGTIGTVNIYASVTPA